LELLLKLWALSFIVLVLSVYVLQLAFRLCGSKFRIQRARNELLIALVISPVLAANIWLGVMWEFYAGRPMFFAAFVAIGLPYYLTHKKDMNMHFLGLLILLHMAGTLGGAVLFNLLPENDPWPPPGYPASSLWPPPE
jgi:hypothetical protein